MPAPARSDRPPVNLRKYVGIWTDDGDGKTPIRFPNGVRVYITDVNGIRWFGWGANCNGAGAEMKVEDGRLKLGGIHFEAAGCPSTYQAEDHWLWRLFDAEPTWEKAGKTLRITAGRRVLKLREVPRITVKAHGRE